MWLLLRNLESANLLCLIDVFLQRLWSFLVFKNTEISRFFAGLDIWPLCIGEIIVNYHVFTVYPFNHICDSQRHRFITGNAKCIDQAVYKQNSSSLDLSLRYISANIHLVVILRLHYRVCSWTRILFAEKLYCCWAEMASSKRKLTLRWSSSTRWTGTSGCDGCAGRTFWWCSSSWNCCEMIVCNWKTIAIWFHSRCVLLRDCCWGISNLRTCFA